MTTPHSIAEFTDPEVSPTNNRHLTVSYASRYPDYNRIPAITLKGQWLEDAGFTTGTQVDVKVMNLLYCAQRTAAATRRKRFDAVAAPGVQAIGA